MLNHYDDYHRSLVKTRQQTTVVGEDDFTYVNLFRYILPELEPPGPGRVLDIGAGAGTVSLRLASIGYRVVGIDVSTVAVVAAKKSARNMMLEDRVTFVRSDLESFPSDETFDAVLALEVIEHARHDEWFLERVRDLLRPDGLLILSTPLKTAPLTRLGMTKRFDESVGHLRRYSRNQIVSKLMRTGFVVGRWVTVEGIMRNSLFVVPWLHPVVRIIRGHRLTRWVTAADDLLGALLGYSDIIVFARRK